MKPAIQSLEYEDICRQAISQIGQAVDVTSARMYDWDPAIGQTSVVAEYYSPEIASQEQQSELGTIYDLSEFPATWRCLVEKRAYVVYADSPDADMSDRARLAAMDYKAMLKIPMVVHDLAVGLIELCETRQARLWHDAEIESCQVLTNQAALVVENARLHKLQRQHSELLNLVHNVTWRLSRARSADQLAQLVADAVAEQFDCTIVHVTMLDEKRRELVLQGAAGSNVAFLPTNYRQSIERGIVGLVARAGQSYLSNNVRKDSYYLSWEGWPRGSELAVPIKRSDSVIGVLNLECEALGAFSAADATVIEIVAGQLAAALENAELYVQTHQQLSELMLLHEIAVASATANDVDSLLRQATCVIAANLYSDNLGFLLLDQAAGVLRPHPSYQGLPARSMELTIPLGQGITGRVAATAAPLVVADVRAEQHYTQLAPDVRSEMAAPLHTGDRVFGVINVESRQPAAFSASDLRLLVTVAKQLSAAIERALAQERAARAASRLHIINEIGRQATATLDGFYLLRQVAEELHKQLWFDYVLTAVVDQAAGLIHVVGYAGGPLPSWLSHPISLEPVQSLLSEAATEGQVIYVPDISANPHYAPIVMDARSELCVPICQATNQVVGLLDLKSRRLAAFEPDDIEAIKALAGQLAVILVNARLHQETQRRLRELDGLYQLSQVFGLITDQTELYGRLTAQMARLLGVEQCGIVLYDPIAKMVVMQAPAYGLRSDQVARYRWPRSPLLPPPWKRGETIIANDLAQDAQANPEIERDLIVELNERNLMVSPLWVGEQCIGTVRVANRVDGAPFTSADAHLLGIFASQAAIAIENSRLLAGSRQRAERLAALQRVGNALVASLELGPMVQALYRELSPLFDVEALVVYMLDPNGQYLHCELVDHGAYQMFQVELASESLGAHVVRTGKPLIVSDMQQERLTLPVQGVLIGDLPQSWLGLPLFLHGQASGAVSLQAYAPGKFGQEELELLSQLAPQVMLTIQNIKSYQQVQQRIAELTILQRASMQVGAVLDPIEIMYVVAENVQRLINATDVRLYRYDPDQDQVTLSAVRSHYRYKAEFDVPARKDGITACVARGGKPLVVNDPSQFHAAADHPHIWNLTAIASIPIKRSERTLAVLNVAFAGVQHQFTNEEVQVLTMLADQAALALENATLFESERRQRVIAETLREMAAIVSASLNLDEVLHRLLDQLRRVVEYDQGSVGLIANGDLVVHAMSGFPTLDNLMKKVAIDSLPLTSQIMLTAQPILLADMQDSSTYPREMLDSIGAHKVRATMGIPIIARGTVIGVIYLDSFELNAFTLDHAHQAQALADHAAMAIVNARLYQALSDRQSTTEDSVDPKF